MTVIDQSSIRFEVRDYLQACANLVSGNHGSHDEFSLASQGLQAKAGKYTDDEMNRVQEMLYRVSSHLGR